MKRVKIQPRTDLHKKLEALSFDYHSLDNKYWDESACYEFNMSQINKIESATNELFEMCLKAVQHVIDNNLFEKFYIDERLIPLIKKSWEEEHASVYGRFDFSFDGNGEPKMLEFNADTPTSLYECAVVQWYWLQDVMQDKDQFNSVHEKLIAYWKSCKDYFGDKTLYFACIKDSIEDFTTVEYLRDTAFQADLNVDFIYIDDIGWDSDRRAFVDLSERELEFCFKLYPWEWMMGEEFGDNILLSGTEFMEPAWKSILSNKAILPVLWELFPNHKNLLEARFDNAGTMQNYVEKPIYSREGANVAIYKNGVLQGHTEGEYGDEGYIYQELKELPNFDGNYPVIGSWVIGGEAAGIGIRESEGLITDNLSRFIPHYINL